MRHRFIYHKELKEMIEVEGDFVPEARASHHPLSGDRYYTDLRATDGTPVDTRTKHREYMKAKGLTVSDDFKGEWAKAAEHRADMYTTGGDHKERRAQVERALYDHVNKRR